jgi:hypothetical protein
MVGADGCEYVCIGNIVEVGVLGMAVRRHQVPMLIGWVHTSNICAPKSTLTTLAGLGQWFWYVLIIGKRMHANAAVLETETNHSKTKMYYLSPTNDGYRFEWMRANSALCNVEMTKLLKTE